MYALHLEYPKRLISKRREVLYCNIQYVERMKMGKVAKTVITVAAILLYGIMYYYWLPTLSLAFLDGVWFFGIGIIIIACLIAMWLYYYNSWDDNNDGICTTISIGTSIIVVISILVACFFGLDFFNYQQRQTQIGEIEEEDFSDDLEQIDMSQVPVVDIDLANKLADKKMGEDPALGSQMRVGTFTNKQTVNGKLIYVAPLEYQGFFTWLNNREGTPGYIIVSATNPNDVQLVQKDSNGEDISLKYVHSACFGTDIYRYVRMHGYGSVGIADMNFELDDNGRPYWVIITCENTILWGCPEANGVVTCDPQTGEIEQYSISDAPKWIDIIQPEELIRDQLKNYGEYAGGIFNFSNENKLSITDHITTVYNEGNCYYYTGLSSVGDDDSTVGFVMVNTRTKEAKRYNMAGATEFAAMQSAEGKVQNMGYSATTPIPLNISGIPTYFCTLKDKEGLVKQYAMVNIEDYSIVATGSSVVEARRAYINAVNNSGASIDLGGEAYGYTVTGTVTRISSNIENGNTSYYMILDNDTTKLYIASYVVSEELPITREGDKVTISFVDQSNGAINVAAFDNLGFTQNISEDQEKLNQVQEQNNLINNPSNNVVEVNPEVDEEQWNSLTDEEKAKLLEQLNESNETE